jgi:hypothetical protein
MSESNPFTDGFDAGRFHAQCSAEVTDLMQAARNWADLVLKDPADHFTPTLICHTRPAPFEAHKAEMYVMHVPFNEDDEKRAALQQIGAQIAERHDFLTAAVIISEAWRIHRKTDAPRVEPRHAPDREEVIVCFSQSLDRKNARHAMRPMARIRGNLRPAGQWETDKAGTAGAVTDSPLLDKVFYAWCSAIKAQAERERAARDSAAKKGQGNHGQAN